jgi:hypothetical protein
MSGIDASDELIIELQRLAVRWPLAARVRRAPSPYRLLQQHLEAADPVAQDLVEALIRRLGVWWSPSLYVVMPVLTPWCVRDRSCRYDQGPEAWGAPRSDGFLRDDNSIIKKLPLPLRISAPLGHPYLGRKPHRGFTACHIWRDLPDGSAGGEDPWLYSFLPNLVWLPRALAPLSDRQGSWVQQTLQAMSRGLFRGVPVHPDVAPVAVDAWRRLDPSGGRSDGDTADLARFSADAKFVQRRIKYIDSFVMGAEEVLDGRPVSRKIVCSRYTAELPGLHPQDVAAFRETLLAYRGAVGRAASELIT